MSFFSKYIFLTAAFLVSSTAVYAEGIPQILVKEPVADFSAVIQGVPITRNFEVKNEGDSELRISHIQPDCGCTVAQPEKLILAPDESMNVSVSFDTTGFYGYKVKTVHIYSNDPKKRSVALTLQGNVRREVEVKPARIFFGNIRKGSDTTKTVIAEAVSDKKIKLHSVSSRSENIIIQVEDSKSADKSKKKFTVSLKDDIPFGTFRSSVVLKTSSAKNPVINIPIFAQVQGDLVLEPSDLSFGLLEGPLQEAVTKNVRLVNNGEAGVTVVKAESENPFVKVVVKPSAKENNFDIIVKLKKGAIGTLHAKVMLKTDHPDEEQREITLPIYGIIAKKGA